MDLFDAWCRLPRERPKLPPAGRGPELTSVSNLVVAVAAAVKVDAGQALTRGCGFTSGF